MRAIIFYCLLICIVACSNKQNVREPEPEEKLSDSLLLDLVQKQTFKYFWDFGHPVSGLSRERSNKTFGYGDEVVTTGGTGFGIMSIIVREAERKWITREQALERLLKMVKFLNKSDRFHGMFLTG